MTRTRDEGADGPLWTPCPAHPQTLCVQCCHMWVPLTVYFLPGSFLFPGSKLTLISLSSPEDTKETMMGVIRSELLQGPRKEEGLSQLTVRVVAIFSGSTSHFTNEENKVWRVPMGQQGILLGCHTYLDSYSRLRHLPRH